MDDPLSYPRITSETKIWTRWWWLGSAVDRENLTRLLTQYRDAGIGGVEICPIYGAKGHEHRYLQYLSPEWMAMLSHTLAEATRLGMGVDLTDGTGWPFGGPQVRDADASMSVALQKIELTNGSALKEELLAGRVQCAIAVSDAGERIDVTSRLLGPEIHPPLPAGNWTLYSAITRQPIQKVKRAAPGAEGNVVDPYSTGALERYLSRFDDAFAQSGCPAPRAHFHDSFEYFEANWTPAFFDEFASRRGYDLRTQLPALMGEGDSDTVARVKCDYRETIHDLHLAYVQRWNAWAHAHHGLSRNQAHGAPGNLLDLYSAADIPETEIFGDVPDSEFVRIQFATSAAHLKGTQLASAEAFTWLGEHFQVSLNDLKAPTDFLFLAGINHLFFHGIPYSPDDVDWPGWLFYASVHFGPQGGLWQDLPAFNAYVARCQSILQSGECDNDLLLYFPQYDFFQKQEAFWEQYSVHSRWLFDTPFHITASELRSRGYSFDVISDRWIERATVTDGKIVIGQQHYAAMVIPRTRFKSPETMDKIRSLAASGGVIIFQEAIPGDVPGLHDLQARRAKLTAAGNGNGFIIANVLESLASLRVRREPMVAQGLQSIRRTHGRGYHYFIANRSAQPFDGWAELGVRAKSAVLLDPMSEHRKGVAALRSDHHVFLQLSPGESCILRTFSDERIDAAKWAYSAAAGEAIALGGKWSVESIEGGPVLPASFETERLYPWTDRNDADARRFCGTARYRIRFNKPVSSANEWRLDLGKVADSARVKLNGRDIGCLWCRPFSLNVGEFLREGENELEIEVTNVAANRIADADRRGVRWKAFHEINFVNRDYKPFDASNWPLREAGLVGPVTLTPMRRVSPSPHP